MTEDNQQNEEKIEPNNTKTIISSQKYFLSNYQSYFKSFTTMNSIGTNFFINNLTTINSLLKTEPDIAIQIFLIDNVEFESKLNLVLDEVLLYFDISNYKNFQLFFKKWCDKYPKILLKSLTTGFFDNAIELMDNVDPFVLRPFFYLNPQHFASFIKKMVNLNTVINAIEKMTISKDPSNILRFMREVVQYVKRCDEETNILFLNKISEISDILILSCVSSKNYVIKTSFLDLIMNIKKSPKFVGVFLKNLKSGTFFEDICVEKIPKEVKVEFPQDLTLAEIKTKLEKADPLKAIKSNPQVAFNILFLNKMIDPLEEKIIEGVLEKFNIFEYLFFYSNVSTIEVNCLLLFKKIIEKNIYPEIIPSLLLNSLVFGRIHKMEKYAPFPKISSKFSCIVDLIKCMKNEGVVLENNDIVNFWRTEIRKTEIKLDNNAHVDEILENEDSEDFIRFIYDIYFKNFPNCDSILN